MSDTAKPTIAEVVARLDALEAKATAAPWTPITPKTWDASRPVSNVMGGDGAEIAFPGGDIALMLHQDCHLIAALRNAYPTLRAAVLRCAELEARAWRYEKALRAIGYEPMGLPEASDRYVLDTCVEIARDALTAPQGEERGA